eukprot:COSAG02_NODE_21506_length_785_cov_1.587464_1_plen_45_part_00
MTAAVPNWKFAGGGEAAARARARAGDCFVRPANEVYKLHAVLEV